MIPPTAVEPGEIARAGDECERRPDALDCLRDERDGVARPDGEEQRPRRGWASPAPTIRLGPSRSAARS